MGVKRINVYLHLLRDKSLYCPFCGRKIDLEYFKEEPCKHVLFIAHKLGDLPEYFVDELPEMLEREP
jgi:hypothetical protein